MSAAPAIDLGGFGITLVREDIYWWDDGAMFGVRNRRTGPVAPAEGCRNLGMGNFILLMD